MKSGFIYLFVCVGLFAADDPWLKVKDIKSGTELRIFKKGAKQPILAKMDELTDEKLLVAGKTEQLAIERTDVDRIDARPQQKGSRLASESKTTSGMTQPGGPGNEPTRMGNQAGGPSQSSSSSLSIGGKPEFETVYRRTATAP